MANVNSVLSGKTNLCQKIRETQGKGLMPDGTTRFYKDGQPIFHYMGCSTFSEYTVLPEISLAKVNKSCTIRRSLLTWLWCNDRDGSRNEYRESRRRRNRCHLWSRRHWACQLLLAPLWQKQVGLLRLILMKVNLS